MESGCEGDLVGGGGRSASCAKDSGVDSGGTKSGSGGKQKPKGRKKKGCANDEHAYKADKVACPGSFPSAPL